MKILFDTNVYVAEALLGETAAELVEATLKARWRIYTNRHILDEVERVMVERLGASPCFGVLTRNRVRRRATLVIHPVGRHQAPEDPDDSPILQGALAAGVDYLVTNDSHLLEIGGRPFGGLRPFICKEEKVIGAGPRACPHQVP